MGAITHGLVLMAMVAVPASVWAGNSTLMERNAEELIDINREVLEGLKAGSQDGEYRLMARIVEQNGERVIKVDRFERLGPPEPDAGHQPALRTARPRLIRVEARRCWPPLVTMPPASALDPSRRLHDTNPQAAPLAAGLATAPLPIPLTNSRQKLEVSV
jgi:hypothetical protein